MITVVKVKLLADAGQLDALVRTVTACNAAATHASRVAFDKPVFNKRFLQSLIYRDLRADFGLSSQAAIRTIAKVADSYKTLHANLRNGRYGKRGSKQFARAAGKPIVFRSLAAQSFDDRILSWQHSGLPVEDSSVPAGKVSIWTVDGRIKDIEFVGFPEHIDLLRKYRKGESDLVIERHRDGVLVAYLVACVDVPEQPLHVGDHLADVDGWIGVDMGIANPAVTSDRELGEKLMREFGDLAYLPELANVGGTLGTAGIKDAMTPRTKGKYVVGSDGAIKSNRKRNRALRRKLQKKGTQSAKRILRQRARKENRFVTDANHRIAKQIVNEAQRTDRGIAIEGLTGIRERVRHRKPHRDDLTSWAFAQLAEFLVYKARRAGVPLIVVDPRNTSRTCPTCRHVDKKNRIRQAAFRCVSCGFEDHADFVGATNIAWLAPTTWARSIVPSAA